MDIHQSHFTLQMMIIGVMVLIPLIFLEALPRQMMFPVGPAAPPPPPHKRPRGQHVKQIRPTS
jgi:hypothetical protein